MCQWICRKLNSKLRFCLQKILTLVAHEWNGRRSVRIFLYEWNAEKESKCYMITNCLKQCTVADGLLGCSGTFLSSSVVSKNTCHESDLNWLSAAHGLLRNSFCMKVTALWKASMAPKVQQSLTYNWNLICVDVLASGRGDFHTSWKVRLNICTKRGCTLKQGKAEAGWKNHHFSLLLKNVFKSWLKSMKVLGKL